jgi:hypothetical protein
MGHVVLTVRSYHFTNMREEALIELSGVKGNRIEIHEYGKTK